MEHFFLFEAICVAIISILISVHIYNNHHHHMKRLPIVDIGCLALNHHHSCAQIAGDAIHNAFRDVGFVVIRNHGLNVQLIRKLESLSQRFFSLSLEEKNAIHMNVEPITSWRGYFETGHEYTSGIRDIKEGLYLGVEHNASSHPRVKRGTPMFGQNKWPTQIPELQAVAMEYMNETMHIAECVLNGVALGLGLPYDYFRQRYNDPTILFRLFNYPIISSNNNNTDTKNYGVGEHSDYGFLTVLWFNGPGLQVKMRTGEWLDVELEHEDDLCVNIGDILEMWTHGYYRATNHRVQVNTNTYPGRLSFPVFFDPSWSADLSPIPKSLLQKHHDDIMDDYKLFKRWDGCTGADIINYSKNMRYGEYLWSKVNRVFPSLAKRINPTKQQLS